MSTEIAKVTFNPKTKRIVKLEFLSKDLRFKCQRCAVFCCKLGGPTLNARDLRRLRKAGAKAKTTIESTKENGVRLKETENGSCAFLEYDVESKWHVCSVYDSRPSLCMLYPFEFTPTGPNAGTLRTIPFCNGLNAADGELVNHKFVEKNLLEPIMDTLGQISPRRK